MLFTSWKILVLSSEHKFEASLQATDFLQAISNREQQLYEQERDAETDRIRANDSFINDLEERHMQELDRLRKEWEEWEDIAKLEGEDLVSKIQKIKFV